MKTSVTLNLLLVALVCPMLFLAQEKTRSGEKVAPPDFVAYEKAPEVITKVEPEYPQVALKSGLEGNVFLKVWVDESGNVVETSIIKSDQEVFNEAAMNAAKQWKFKPAISNGKPVAVWVSIPFRFKLTASTKHNPENREAFTEALQSIASNIIQGGNLEKAKSSIDPGAYVIDGNRYENLWAVLNGEVKTCHVVEGADAKISYFNVFVTDDMSTACMVIKSISADGKRERYNTVLFVKQPTGEWKVKSWHVSG
jgi:TonB family protein